MNLTTRLIKLILAVIAIAAIYSSNPDDSGGIGWLGYLAGALVLAVMMLFYYRSQAITVVTKITGKPWIEKNVSGYFGIFSVAKLVKDRYKLMVDHFGQTVVDESIRAHGFAFFVKPILENLVDSRLVNHVLKKHRCKLDDLGQIELSSEGNDKLDRVIKVCKKINYEFGDFNKAHVSHYFISYGSKFTHKLRDYLANFSGNQIFEDVNKYGKDSLEYLSLKKLGYKEQLIADAFEKLGADKARAFLSFIYALVGDQDNEEITRILNLFAIISENKDVINSFSKLRGDEKAESYWKRVKTTFDKLNMPITSIDALVFAFVTIIDKYAHVYDTVMDHIDHKLLTDIRVFHNACSYQAKYGSVEIVQKILSHEIWEGATKEQIQESWGMPNAIDKRLGSRVTWEGWYYGGQTEKTAKRVVWFRKSSNKGEEGARKWNIKN